MDAVTASLVQSPILPSRASDNRSASMFLGPGMASSGSRLRLHFTQNTLQSLTMIAQSQRSFPFRASASNATFSDSSSKPISPFQLESPAEVDVLRDEIRRKKLAVFVSGGGSNFKKLHEGCNVGTIKGDIVLLVTNKRDCGGAEYARSNGIPVLVYPKGKREPSDGLSSTDLVDVLRKYGVDFVLLAGYLRIIPAELVQVFPKRILNIHPALLPAFGGKGLYGERVHKAVLASGARYSGPTIHFVDEEYDTGRILAQRVVRVNANDTPEELAKRVLHEEHKLYVEVVAAICEERIKWREDGVPLIQSKEDPDLYY